MQIADIKRVNANISTIDPEVGKLLNRQIQIPFLQILLGLDVLPLNKSGI